MEVISRATDIQRQFIRLRSGGLRVWVGVIASLGVAPLLWVLFSVTQSPGDILQHFISTFAVDYLLTTLSLMVLVVSGCLLLGGILGICVARLDFPGRSVFRWALMLPMAAPAYIVAYAYTGLLDYGAPLPTLLRDWQGSFQIPEIRSLEGAACVLIAVLFPYVYALVLAAAVNRPPSLTEAARVLGCSPWRVLWRVELPLLRPALAAGGLLVALETLADYGTVKYFGVDTLSTGVFRLWFTLGDLGAAMHWGASLASFAIVLMFLQFLLRGRETRFSARTLVKSVHPLICPSRWQAWVIACLCGLTLAVTFIVPVGYLFWLAALSAGWKPEYSSLIMNSIALAGLVSSVAVLVSFTWIVMTRRDQGLHAPFWSLGKNILSLGYGVPGVVVAVGALGVAGHVDAGIEGAAASLGIEPPSWYLVGSMTLLVWAGVLRFLAVALRAVKRGIEGIPRTLDEQCALLGHSARQVTWRLYLPLARPGILAGVLLVFVDVIKELPATLVLRPIGFDTLAVRAFEFASDERLADAAWPSLIIVAVGLLPILLLRPGRRGRAA